MTFTDIAYTAGCLALIGGISAIIIAGLLVLVIVRGGDDRREP